MVKETCWTAWPNRERSMKMCVQSRTVSVQSRTDPQASLPAVNHPKRVVYETDLVRVGMFRCEPNHPFFENSGTVEHDCFVFPRTAVVIEHDHDRPFVANPNVVTFYNQGDEYQRRPIAPDGDRSDWFAVRHDIVLDILRSMAPEVDQRPERPFRVTHALSTPRAYAFQRQLFTRLTRRPFVEPLQIEEGVIQLLESVLRSARRHSDRCEAIGDPRRRADLVHAAKTILSGEFAGNMTLSELASRLDVSVFHLCRVFRRLAGCSIHEYRRQLRLRWSLERLNTRQPRSLVDCALEAGFSSHSHYGSAFRRSFGQTPSAFAHEIMDS
jgi:AraC family transcriptional regulator